MSIITRLSTYRIARDIAMMVVKDTLTHEAGRAVAFLRLGGSKGAGTLYAKPSSNGFLSALQLGRDEEAVLLASGYAACVLTGQGEADAACVVPELLERIVALGHDLDIAQAAAVELMSQPGNVDAVSLVAEVLFECWEVDLQVVGVALDVLDGRSPPSLADHYLSRTPRHAAAASALRLAFGKRGITDASWRPRDGGGT